MIRLLLTRRIGNLVGFLVCAGMLAFGYYLQFVVALEPCPLCIIQRLLLFAVGVAFLIAALHHPAGRLGAGLYGGVIEIDEDAREEYWVSTRGMPECKHLKVIKVPGIHSS